MTAFPLGAIRALISGGEGIAACLALIEGSISETAYVRCEQAARVASPSPLLRELITGSMLICLDVHTFPRKRGADAEKALRQVARLATAAAENMERLAAVCDDLAPPWVRRVFWERIDAEGDLDERLSEMMARLRHVAATVEGRADLIRKADKGGSPPKAAFGMLVKTLANGFERVTGRRAAVTLNREGYGGAFVNLVEAVIPLAVQLDPDFLYPTSPRARGKSIQRALRVAREKGDIQVTESELQAMERDMRAMLQILDSMELE